MIKRQQQNWLLEKILQLKVNNKRSLLLLIYFLQDGIMLLPPTENVTLHYNLPLRQNLECEGPKFTVLDQAKNVKKNNFHYKEGICKTLDTMKNRQFLFDKFKFIK